jgi:hypothetical protein
MAKYAQDLKGIPTIYELYGVSNHMGTPEFGHYTAFVKDYKSKNWCEFNDSQVRQIYDSKIVTKSAYLLFYRKKDFKVKSVYDFQEIMKFPKGL